MEAEKKYFGGWWLWILLLMVLSTFVGAGLRYLGIFGERLMFENSYQYFEARKTEIATFRAELAEIERRLSGNVEPSVRQDLEAQASALRVQIEVSKSRGE